MSELLASASVLRLVFVLSIVLGTNLLLYVFVVRYGETTDTSTPAHTASPPATTGAENASTIDAEHPVDCPDCGVRTDARFRYCWNCLASVPGQHASADGTSGAKRDE